MRLRYSISTGEMLKVRQMAMFLDSHTARRVYSRYDEGLHRG